MDVQATDAQGGWTDGRRCCDGAYTQLKQPRGCLPRLPPPPSQPVVLHVRRVALGDGRPRRTGGGWEEVRLVPVDAVQHLRLQRQPARAQQLVQRGHGREPGGNQQRASVPPSRRLVVSSPRTQPGASEARFQAEQRCAQLQLQEEEAGCEEAVNSSVVQCLSAGCAWPHGGGVSMGGQRRGGGAERPVEW
jgi:hypothetical protein